MRKAKKYFVFKKDKNKVSYHTKSWSESEIEILLNNSLEKCLDVITTKCERFIKSKWQKVNNPPKAKPLLGKQLDLHYKNDYSKSPNHLPETKVLNKRLVRVALRKT